MKREVIIRAKVSYSSDKTKDLSNDLIRNILNNASIKSVNVTATFELVKHYELSIKTNNESEANVEAHKRSTELFINFCKNEKLEIIGIRHEVKEAKVMSYDQNHNEKLVDAINKIYDVNENDGALSLIINALYAKYREESESKGINFCHDIPYNEFLHNFLMYVCDDNDLETIINFVNKIHSNK